MILELLVNSFSYGAQRKAYKLRSHSIGFLPAAGTASRMQGLPKFMLPASEDVKTLIELQIKLMLPYVEEIYIPTRPENLTFFQRLDLPSNVIVSAIETSTMSETVRVTLANVDFDWCILGMPDTYFHTSGNPYEFLHEKPPSTDIALACYSSSEHQRGQVGSILIDSHGYVRGHADKDSGQHFGWHWGAMAFSKEAFGLIDPSTPTVGYVIDGALEAKLQIVAKRMSGNYFDCGTFSEYLRCLNAI